MLDEAKGAAELPDEPTGESHEDHLLTVDEAAEVLAVERTWVYRHADKLPFTRKLSPGTAPLLFEWTSTVDGESRLMNHLMEEDK